MTEVSLPGMPEDPPPSPPPPAGVRVRRYRPRTRMLCGDCIAQIHALGVAAAPVPGPVRWQVSYGALSLHLCEQHKNIRLESFQ